MSSATKCSFQNFDLKYYKGLTPKGKRFYEIMKKNYTFCIEYAENFSERSKNIFIMGLTGLGKTHLSLAIANVVLKKGYEVICGSMSTLLQKVEAEHFGREKTNSKFLQELIDVDFLIMDDIGAEHKTEFNESMLYTIINTRINTKKVTLANSNLTAVQFDKRYNTRITSRMLNDFHVLGFLGNDIREQMKREKK
jgi:DNA replication protein DnaC